MNVYAVTFQREPGSVYRVLASSVKTAGYRALCGRKLNAKGLTITLTITSEGKAPKCRTGRHAVVPGQGCGYRGCAVEQESR